MNLSEFAASYYGYLAEHVYKDPAPVGREDTALVLIDVQDLVSVEDMAQALAAFGYGEATAKPVLDEYAAYLTPILDNIKKLLAACREKGIRPIHVKVESYLPDAADAGLLHRTGGLIVTPGGPGSAFLPLEGEIVLKKTCSGAHVGTPIDRIMRNLGIRNVYVVGFYADQCVSTAVRDFADLGYRTTIVADAVGSMSPDRQARALEGVANIYARAETTESLLERIAAL